MQTEPVTRSTWLDRIDHLWTIRSIVWLSGVRRVGKTSLCRQLPGGRYMNCDLPSVQRQLADPEAFLADLDADVPLLLDEVHRIPDPSLALKIAADEFPRLRILATGSSTLEATSRFRDTLTDRKRALQLVPVLWRECRGPFGVDLDRRLLHGGLPGVLLQDHIDPGFFEDWVDSFYARDIQDLFGIRNRTAFLALLRLVALRNGGLLDITDLARQTGASRPTVMSHLDAMEVAHAIRRVPPYHGGGTREIVRRPRVFAFDTGLVTHVQGWHTLRDDDRGHLWENLVLDELCTVYPPARVRYWRDKSGRELDFVVAMPDSRADVYEAKINPDAFAPGALAEFRRLYPRGVNHLVCPHVREPYAITRKGHVLQVIATPDSD